jgi:heme A synthase
MGKPAIQPRGRTAWMAGISLGVVVLLGVSGAIAALGDTLFPAASLAAGFAQDWDPAANIFLRLRGLHPLIAAAAGAWLLFYSYSSAVARPGVRSQALTVAVCLCAQILAGVVNLLLLAPVWMQIVHLLLADLLWISLVVLCAAMLAEQREQVRPA